MIVSGNKFNTPQRIQNKRQNDNAPSFGISEGFSFSRKKSSPVKSKFGAICAGLSLAILASASAIHNKIETDPKKLIKTELPSEQAENAIYKVSLLKTNGGEYIRQLIDSVNGGKSTPNTTFKTDSLVQREVDIFNHQADSLMDDATNSIKHADELRNFAHALSRIK